MPKKNIICILIFVVLNVITLNSKELNFNKLHIAQYNQNTNSTQIDTINKINNLENSKYISESEFFYGDHKRYSITGKRPLKETDINPWAFGAFTGTYVAFMITQHLIQVNTIWEEQGDFKIIEDGQYALQADKAGHFFGAYYASYFFNEGFQASGLSNDAAAFWGAMMGLSYQLYIEIMDGFGVNWGFSPSDFYADVAGSLFYILQHHFPILQNFTPKFMYFPANLHGELRRQPHDMFIDDYSSHTMWMSVNVHNLLSDNFEKYWPNWLELSFGYAARNLCDQRNPNFECNPEKSHYQTDVVWGSPRFILALDYNLVKIIPEGPNFVNWLVQSLNYFKMPSPAVEFGPGLSPEFYFVYPFRINF